MADLGPLNIDKVQLPQIDVGSYVPDIIKTEHRAPIIVNQPRSASALETKYAPDSYFNQLAASGQYDPRVIEAMRRYDAQRVSLGQAPLSEDETRNSLLAAQAKQPQTKPADKSMLDVPGNFIDDLGNIIKSIPRIPTAIAKEVMDVPKIGDAISAGKNPIAGLANAPLVRMLPGAFTIGNIAGGTPGELARHPLFTLLDLLPAGEALAKGTGVVKEATRLSEGVAKGEIELGARDARLVGKQAARPIKTALLNKLDAEGNIIRNTPGELVDKIAETKMVRPIRQFFSQANRDVMFAVSAAGQRTIGIMNGEIKPTDALHHVARETMRVTEELRNIDPTIIDHAGEFYTRLTTGQMDGMPETWQRGAEVVRQMNQRMGEWARENEKLHFFNGEYYDVPTGKKLISLDEQAKRSARFNALRGDVLGGAGGVLEPATVAGNLLTDLRESRTPKGEIGADFNMVRKARMRQLANAGYDTTELEQLWTDANRKVGAKTKKGTPAPTADIADYEAALSDIANGTTKPVASKTILPADQLIEKLRGIKGDEASTVATNEGIAKIQAGIKNNEWKTVTEGIDQIRRSKNPALQDAAIIDSIKELRDTSRLLQKDLAGYTDAKHATVVKRLESATREAVPARYMPAVADAVKKELAHRLIPVADGMAAEEVVRLGNQGLWSEIPGFTDKLYRKVERDASKQWMAMRDSGLDPVFVHTVPLNKASQAIHPGDMIVPREASSIRARVLDMTPGVQDVTVGLTHQAQEFLSQQQTELAIKQIADSQGVSENLLRKKYAETAERRAAQNTALNFEGHLQQLMNAEWKKFNPEEAGYNWGSPYLEKLGQEQVWIPKGAYQNLKALANPRSILGGVLDPVTGLFRMATTGLSLRTQIFNIIGGGIALELDRPGALLRSGEQARAWMRDPTLIPDRLKEVVGQQKRTLLEMDKESLGVINEGVFHYAKGKMLKRFWDTEQAAKASTLGTVGEKFGGAIKGLMKKSYDLNGMFDDFYRMTGYIDTYDKAISKGYTAKAAEDAAIATTRNVLQDWMGMTPMERSVMKSIFPFYSYMGHAVRFVLRYPFDHPIRAEVLSKIAMSELEDQGALPSRFMSMMFFGGQGAAGERNAINLGPMNPFGDVANFMTIQGMLGNTNPVIETALEMAGLTNGQADLYPSLRYNPETGRLDAAHNNPLAALLSNTVPQSDMLTAMLGINQNYNDLLKRDPAAATRFIASSLTLPIPWRSIQVNQEAFKAEVARETATDKVKQEALKSGDWSEALMYPSLREYLAMVDSLPDDVKAPYNPITRADALKETRTSTGDKSKYKASPFDQVLQAYEAQVSGHGLVQPGTPSATVNPFASSPQTVAAGGATQSAPGVPLPGASLTVTNGGI